MSSQATPGHPEQWRPVQFSSQLLGIRERRGRPTPSLPLTLRLTRLPAHPQRAAGTRGLAVAADRGPQVRPPRRGPVRGGWEGQFAERWMTVTRDRGRANGMDRGPARRSGPQATPAGKRGKQPCPMSPGVSAGLGWRLSLGRVSGRRDDFILQNTMSPRVSIDLRERLFLT